MDRTEALGFIGHCLDNALSPRQLADMPDNAVLVGWQCGFEPMFVVVWSYLGVPLDAEEAVGIATDYLDEIKWFADGPIEPEYIITG